MQDARPDSLPECLHALEQARELCEACGVTLEQVVDECLPAGIVYITQDCVLCAERWPDAWFVRLAVGKNCLHRWLALAPEPLEYVAWQREVRGQKFPRLYSFKRLQALIASHAEQTH